VINLVNSFVWWWNFGKFWKVVLEKDGHQLEWSCKEWKSLT
jgi:hypothetical protein